MSRRILIDDDAAQYENIHARLKRLENARRATTKQALAFGSGWGNYGGGYEGATYSRIGNIVILQGLVTKSGGTPAFTDLIATLPEGFRPQLKLLFPTHAGEPNQVGRVDVGSDGRIEWISGGTGETDFTSLSGIAFMID